ncbi:MAG: rhomboid family intramembrane serine protease [Caldilineaceae bacterium]
MITKVRTDVLKREALKSVAILGVFVAFLWILEAVDWIFWGGQLDGFGIRPRTMIGVRNILIAPFLHNGWAHLLSNTAPLLILGALVMIRGTSDFITVTIVSILVSGAGVWLLGGAHTLHLGASGIIFGYLGYLLTRGYLERSGLAILLALVAIFLYGGIIWGVLPLQNGVSWLGHLFGLIGGGVAARTLVQRA